MVIAILFSSNKKKRLQLGSCNRSNSGA